MTTIPEQLAQLTALHQAGALNDEEFRAAKREVLGHHAPPIDQDGRHSQARSKPTANARVAPRTTTEQSRPSKAASSTRDTQRRTVLWKVYFAYCVLQFVLIIYIAMASHGAAPDPLGLEQTQQSSNRQKLEVIHTLCLGVGLVGLFGFVFGVHVGRQTFWSRFYKGFIFFDVLSAAVNFYEAESEWATLLGAAAGPIAVIMGLLVILTHAPQYYALYQYSKAASWRPPGH
jgi:hypothetical protein